MEQEQERINRVLTTMISEVDRRIYNLIKQSHGCTKKDLKDRTKYQASYLDKILKQLSAFNLIKSVKKAQSKNMNVWVLFGQTQEEDQDQIKQDNQDLMTLIRSKQGPLTATELKKQAIRKGFKIDIFDSVINALMWKGQIYVSTEKDSNQKIIKKRIMKKVHSPCIDCKLKDLCTPDGVINPKVCPYLLNW